MFVAEKSLTVPGVSSTGTKHDLLLEYGSNDYRITILGANGKRHASSIVGEEWAGRVMDFFGDDDE